MLLRRTEYLLLCVAIAGTAAGCDRPTSPKSGENSSRRAVAASSGQPAFGPDTSPVKPILDDGWCGGHGVPESVCTRCNDALIPEFQKAGDWCKEHELPETQCTKCHPDVAPLWAALNPAKKATAQSSEPPANPAPAPAAAPVEREQWCFEHGVTRDACTRCDASLIAKFKAAHDWCGEHGVPESQCVLCNPAAREKWEALRPRSAAPAATVQDSVVTVEHNGQRRSSAENDPLCPIESSVIRFRDASVARQAGIEVTTVRPRRISAAIEVSAETEYDATRVTRVTPRVSGVVRAVNATAGQVVQTGDVLALLDSAVLGEARSQLIERRQDFRVAESEQQRVQAVGDGMERLLAAATPTATAGEVRERLEGVPVGEPKARLLRAHANLLFAKAQSAREAQLFADKVNAEKDVQAAEAALAAAEAEFFALREELAFARQREQIAAERGLAVARSALETAERRLHILGLSDAQVAAIGGDSDETLLQYEVRSPAAGRIVDRRVSAGEAVDVADPLFVIADTSSVWLSASVYERDAPALREGQAVLFTVDGLPGEAFDGRLNWISAEVDDKTRMVTVRADLPNPDGALRAHMFGRARIILRDSAEALCIPTEAVQTDGCCRLAFVREADDRFVPRKVRLGASANGYAEVLSGLREGETIASAGTFLLKTEILKGSIGAGCCDVDPGR